MTWLWTPKYQGLKRSQLGLARWPSLYSGHCARRFVWKTCMSVSILSHFYVCSFHYILINIPNNHKPSCVWYTFFSLQTCQLKLLTNMCCHACLMQCVANTYVATCSTNMCFWAFVQTARSCEQKRMQWFCDTCSVLFVHSYLPKNCWNIRSAIKLKEQALSAWNSTGHGRRMPAGRRLYRCANRWNCPSLSPGSFSTSCWQWRRFQIHHWHTRSLSRIRAGRSSSRFSGFWVAGFKHRGPSRLHGAAGKPPDGADAGCSGGGVIGVPLDKVWRRRRGHATQRCRAAASRRLQVGRDK